MKCSVCIAVLSLCALALAQGGNNRQWDEPVAKCSWSAKVVEKTYHKYQTTYVWVFGQYVKKETYDYKGGLISAELYRPDLLQDQMFVFTGTSCYMEDIPADWNLWGYEEITGLSSKDFDHIEETTYNGEKCWGYYDDDAQGNPDPNTEMYYMNMDGFIVAHTSNVNDWETRVTREYSYGGFVTMSDFTFDFGRTYRCYDDRAFQIPDPYWAQCAASTTRVILSVVLATVFVALTLVF